MSDTTTCSCATSSADKCSVRGCGMFQEPFFLHPPGSRPRDGIYINPMSAYIGEPARPKDTESFYLHSPHDLVYTRITRLFTDTEKQRRSEKKDEPLTVKVDVHVDNGPAERSTGGNGYHPGKPDVAREPSEHAYEQICLRQDQEVGEPAALATAAPSVQKKVTEMDAIDRSRPRKTDRRYSRSSSASESSNLSSEIAACVSPSTSTPSLSRNSSNERIGRKEKKDSTGGAAEVESEKEIKPAAGGAGFPKPPPPPPPPLPPDKVDVVVLVVNGKQNAETAAKDENRETSGDEASIHRDGRNENRAAAPSATNKSDASCGENPQSDAPAASSPASAEEIKANQTSHLVNKHMVLPFIPPQFANADSNTLLKPSEYLRSICNASAKNSLSKARSVDNLDIQSRGADRKDGLAAEEREESRRDAELTVAVEEGRKETAAGPPPPPLSPLQKSRRNGENGDDVPTFPEPEHRKNPQPLATISIQDLTSIQLRRTTAKMNATKTFSAPPPRSVSMTNVSEAFFVQKTDLIAELKRTKDIPGIKKHKVEMAQVEKTQEQNLMSEISKAFNVSNFVDQIPEKDSAGNAIPIWKRQMLARKAAERAKKELEEQIARENEERRQKAIPAWKRQLLAKKDTEEKRLSQTKAEPTVTTASPPKRQEETPPEVEEKKCEENPKSQATQGNQTPVTDDEAQIIPWRAQLRKTNSKLSILD